MSEDENGRLALCVLDPNKELYIITKQDAPNEKLCVVYIEFHQHLSNGLYHHKLHVGTSVGIETGYRLDDRGSIFGRISLYSIPSRPVLRLLSRGYGGRSVKMTTHPHLVPRSRIMELYFRSPYVFMALCLIN
jgi:hypothetical protein